MFKKLFGGPVVQLVEYHEGQLLYRSKKEPKLESGQSVRVAGDQGSPAKIQVDIVSRRSLETGGFLCRAEVADPGHRKKLASLRAATQENDPGMRQYPRMERRVDINCTDLRAVSIDISTGGMQVETAMALRPGQDLKLLLTPGLYCQSRVAWVQGPRAGLQFRDTDEASKLLLSRFANGRMIPTARKPTTRSKSVAPPDYEALG